ncbi:MAG: LysR family transcriptional regulator [Eubacterium sp.]|jgi:Transcriptional regulator|nr:LysR family transcriptional regulator [Eubacterium sp.]
MNSTQVEYFLSLCKYKNYSETARRLFVSQSTVSKQISSLEEELGMKLFERSTNSLRLTMQGAIMQEAISDAINIFSDACEKALNYNKRIADTIRIGVLEGADIGFCILDSLTEIIAQFKNQIDIQISFYSHRDLNTCLRDNALDIGITLKDEVKNHTELNYTKLRTMSLGIIAHRSLGIIKNGQLNLDEVKKQPFFFATDGSLGIKEYLRNQKETLELSSSQYQNVPNIDSILMNVELGIGMAIVPNTQRIERNENIEFFPLDGQSVVFAAAWNRKNENSSRNLIIKRMRRIIIENGQF